MTDTAYAGRVEVLAVPFGEVSRRTREGYRERLAHGACLPSELVGLPVIDAHTGSAVGVVETATLQRDGIATVLRLSATDRARDLVTLSRDGALGASVGFDAHPDDRPTMTRDGILDRTRIAPAEVSLAPLTAYAGARVLSVRERPPAMSATDPAPVTPTAPTEPPPAVVTEPAHVRAAPPSPAPVTVQHVDAAALEALTARVDALGVTPDHVRTAHPLSAFGSLGAFAQAAYRGDVTPEQVRAWVNQVPADNPGVMQPVWLTDVRGIIAQSRAMIEGTGGPLDPGASGMDVHWPYYDGDLSSLIGVQAAPKTGITSAAVSLKRGQASLETYAGGSDLAFQLIERSTPAYLDAYLRIMAAAFGVVTEAAYASALATNGTPVPGVTLPDLYAAIVDEAANVVDATGASPSIVGISADLWGSIAGAVDSDGRPIYPPVAPSNAPGTPDGPAAVDGISIAGLRAKRSRGLPAGTIVVTNGAAARWMEDGPRTIQADHVALLGRDVAVYGYATDAVFTPAGVRVLTGIAPAARAKRGSK